MSRPWCLGIFRERAHSPGRETDDAEILRLTGKRLETRGWEVVLKEADALNGPTEPAPRFVFLMCERLDALDRLRRWEAAGMPHVNSPAAVLNTYRERMVAQLAEAGVPFIASRFVSTEAPAPAVESPVWVKRADVHNTQTGDVLRADTTAEAAAALSGLAARGIPRAVLQPHVDGDLVKFYGIGAGRGPGGVPPWFRWFYHKDQQLAGHRFDAGALGTLVRRAAAALGLEVWGGDAIVTAGGDLTLLDVNAWPSFALYRDEASAAIAGHLAERFGRGSREGDGW
ncbi:MAG: hypothetical protein ACRELS_00770 [Candidatus Rokuibacteriota bacterium]